MSFPVLWVYIWILGVFYGFFLLEETSALWVLISSYNWGCGEFEGWVKGELRAARLAGAILESSTNVVTQHGPTQHNTTKHKKGHPCKLFGVDTLGWFC